MEATTLFVLLLSNGFVCGVPVWFFFIQSPLLFTELGREKFVPPMMKMTRALFRWTLPIAAGVAFATSTFVFGLQLPTVLAGVSLSGAAINSVFVVPAALKAGAATHDVRRNDATKTVQAFAIDGAASNGTRVLHQTVVAFVVVMLIGAVGQFWAVASLLMPI